MGRFDVCVCSPCNKLVEDQVCIAERRVARLVGWAERSFWLRLWWDFFVVVIGPDR